MSVIETITQLLSGKGDKIIEETEQVKAFNIALPLELADDYEDKISYIGVRFSELSDSIRHDMSVIKAISDLLTGKGGSPPEAAIVKEEAELEMSVEDTDSTDDQKKNNPVSSPQENNDDAAIDRESSADDIAALSDAVKEISGVVESLQDEIKSLTNVVKELSAASESVQHTADSGTTTENLQSVTESDIEETIADNAEHEESINDLQTEAQDIETDNLPLPENTNDTGTPESAAEDLPVPEEIEEAGIVVPMSEIEQPDENLDFSSDLEPVIEDTKKSNAAVKMIGNVVQKISGFAKNIWQSVYSILTNKPKKRSG